MYCFETCPDVHATRKELLIATRNMIGSNLKTCVGGPTPPWASYCWLPVSDGRLLLVVASLRIAGCTAVLSR